MDGILTQNEVDALMSSVKKTDQKKRQKQDASSAEARSYDLTSNDRIIRGRMPTLEILNQRLARLMQLSFFNMFRKTVDVSYVSTQLIKYSEFIDGVSVPACLNVFRMPPLRNTCLVSVDSTLMFGLVDFVFGGAGARYRVESRDYSSIELKLIQQVVSTLLSDLRSAWEPIVDVTPEYIRTEGNPQFAAVAAPTDVTIVIAYEVELEASTKGTISLLIPYGVIQPIRSMLSSALQTDRNQEDGHWTSAIKVGISEIDVDVRVELGQASITVGELLALEVGDTIRLEQDSAKPIKGYVEGIHKLSGHPVQSRGMTALRLAGLDIDQGGRRPTPSPENQDDR
ncbi:MAG: flagellar motor switch protein FliM [Myxococcota bacterium]